MPLPADDAPVVGDTPIYRLVPIDQCDPDNGAWVFRSGAFDNSSLEGVADEMSVVIGDTLAALARDPASLPQQAYPNEAGRWGVAVLRGGLHPGGQRADHPAHADR